MGPQDTLFTRLDTSLRRKDSGRNQSSLNHQLLLKSVSVLVYKTEAMFF